MSVTYIQIYSKSKVRKRLEVSPYIQHAFLNCVRVSAVGIVTRMRGGQPKVLSLFPRRSVDFFRLQSFQTGCVFHLVPYSMDTRRNFVEVKQLGREF